MGRVEARFTDWRIGAASHWAQLWIDRNFALDYTLKSMEKILDGPGYHVVRDLRRTIKTAGYRLLGGMIEALGRTDTLADTADELHTGCLTLADQLLAELRAELDTALATVTDTLPGQQGELLRREHARWAENTSWRLINVADPCGT